MLVLTEPRAQNPRVAVPRRKAWVSAVDLDRVAQRRAVPCAST